LKPGDVITISNGKTVEIIYYGCGRPLRCWRTGLSYARKMALKNWVDVAYRPTGALPHLPWETFAPVPSRNNPEMVERITRARGPSPANGMWAMPHGTMKYKDANKSDVADIKKTLVEAGPAPLPRLGS